MLLFIYVENDLSVAFALFEKVPVLDHSAPLSQENFYISNQGHYDVHRSCEFNFENYCRFTVYKCLDLNVFITALQFDHPMAIDEPLELFQEKYPN